MSIELRIDVSQAVPLASPVLVEIAASVYLPPADAIANPPVVMFASPGGGYSRGYFDLQFSGHERYSEAEHHVRRGIVFVAYDHLGVGDSTVPDIDCITLEMLAAANDAAVRAIAARIEEGTLTPRLPPLPRPFRIGVGQSMGGCITIAMQGLHRTFDAIAVLGYSAIHTVPPLKDPAKRQGLIDATRALNRRTDPTTLSIEERTSSHTDDDMSYPHHWEDVPKEIVRADTPKGFAFRKSGTWPPAWRSASMPRCALIMLSPGCVASEAAAITVPVLTAMGERDVCPEPHHEAAAYCNSPDVSLYIAPRMAHMHNFASTRALLWERIVAWALMVARNARSSLA